MTSTQAYLQDDNGYTLLELLVSVAILALLVAPISGSVSIGLSSWESSHKFVEEQEHIALTRQRLESWLLRTYPLDTSRKSLQSEDMLLGDNESLEFSTSIHPDPLQDALYRVRLRLRDEALEIAAKPDFSYQNDGEDWVWDTIVDGVETLSLDYMFGLDVNNDAIWMPEWGGTVDTAYLPNAVRMRVTLLNKDLEWPDLIVPLKIEEQAYCEFLVNERTCKAGATVG